MKQLFKIKYVISLTIIFLIQGCEKDFLERKPSTAVSDKDVFSTTESSRGVLAGIYKHMRVWNYTQRADCTGLHANHMGLDVMAGDITMEPMSWYWFDYDHWHTYEGYHRVHYYWWFFYTVINNCNNILEHIDEATGPQNEKDNIKGEALALRGYSYFFLVRLFQHTYSHAKDMPAVPIYTTPANPETEGNPRASVQAVYDRVLTDLNDALLLMGRERETKYYMNTNVINGLLARVYLTMENWQKAMEHAREARDGFPLMSSEQWSEGFNNYSNPEWIWGMHQSTDQNLGWGNPHSFLDYSRGTIGNFRINDRLVETYSANDIRGNLIVLLADGRYGNQKFREPSSLNSGHWPLMRSSEMYLIEAESLARLGSAYEEDAAEALYQVQHRADPDASISVNTGDQLIEEILLERRKELWAEGFALFDLIRNKKPLVREGDHTSNKNFPANSWEFIHQIPLNEILINDQVNREEQNPRSGIFIPAS